MDVSQYLEIFIDESNEHLQSLSDQLMILEKEPENSDTINEIFRAAHSLKGMAGTMGYKRMQNLTHDMEDVFSEVRNGNIKVDSRMVDVLFQCLDALESYVDNIRNTQDEGTDDNEPIIKELNDFLANEGQENAQPKEEKPQEEAKPEGGTDETITDVSLADFERILEFLEPVNSKDYINLKHYYDIARNNQREYSKLSYLYKTVSNKPLDIIHSAKKKVKVYEDDAA